jgi:hypothetical protein
VTSTEPRYDKIPSREIDSERDQLIVDKYRAAWGAAYAQEGLKGALDALYIALFYPSDVDDIPNNDAFEGRREALMTSLSNTEEIPEPDKFMHVMLEAINRDANYKDTLREDDPDMSVHDGIKAMATHGKLSMWSQGDNAHQAHKMRQAGIGDVRRDVASELDVRPGEAIGFIVGDKFKALEEQVLPEMLAADEHSVIVFDDRQDNLDRVAAIIERFNEEHGTSITPVLSWARIGKNKDKVLTEEETAYYHPAGKVSDMVAISVEQPKGTRTLLDYDGTLSDDTLRLQATLDAVKNALQANNWA